MHEAIKSMILENLKRMGYDVDIDMDDSMYVSEEDTQTVIRITVEVVP